MLKRLFFLLIFGLSMSGCASLPQPEGFVFQEIKTKDFSLASWARVKQKGKALRIYIEGDGYAWINPYTPSSDPTPSQDTVLNLVRKDAFDNVIYLARPCQYVFSSQCSPYFWTSGRFDPAIVRSMAQGIRQLMQQYQARSVELVGYSGGASVALLIALQNKAVSKVYTIAGVLDHRAWTSFHQDSPLKGSLNPADHKSELARIPQIHYIGARDETVPFFLTQDFVKSLGSKSKAEVVVIPDATHDKGWNDIWNGLVNRIDTIDK